MELVSPGIGLIFWMTIAFICVLLILRKYAWKPILANIRIRERAIARSLLNAKRVEDELAGIDAVRSKRLEETEQVCVQMIQHAESERERILAEAKSDAFKQAQQIMEQAAKSVELHKMRAMMEVKGQVAKLSLEIAEKVLAEEFSEKERSIHYVHELLDQVLPN